MTNKLKIAVTSLLGTLAAITIVLVAKADLSRTAAAAVTPAKTEIITVSEDTTVLMDSVFEDASVREVMFSLKALSDKSSHDTTLYLVMDTPGGSVDAGLRLIEFAKALPQKVKTITIFAASMGFQTVSQLDERLILPSGTLMSHPISFGIQGSTPYQVMSRYNWVLSMANTMDVIASTRMGLGLQPYKDLIHDEYWVVGHAAVKDHAADRVVLARCGKYSTVTKKKAIETMFGSYVVEVASCPFIPGYKIVSTPKDQNKNALDYIKLLLGDKAQFTRQFILTNKYREFQR